jgi:hypothetical protein
LFAIAGQSFPAVYTMWNCPKCGQAINDVFDACWKCGTGQDGILSDNADEEPRDSGGLEQGPEAESLGGETDEGVCPTTFDLNGRVVELCSAADAFEAHAIRSRLEEAGIRCRVVGELVENGAGLAGEAVSPRLWVRQEDAPRAREVIDEWTRPFRSEADGGDRRDEDVEPEDNGSSAFSGVWWWLGAILVFTGILCIVLGTVWAWQDWIMLHQCTGTAEGVFTRYIMHFSRSPVPRPEIRIVPQPADCCIWYDACYEFVVGDKSYFSVAPCARVAFAATLIHYDPQQPETNYPGLLSSPWKTLATSLGIGGLLCLAGQFLRRVAIATRVTDVSQ